ncbi:hypothetical protein J7J90_02790 [Candidatus Micrarchaeota archaeon]|nr:hypothetical protein [Candidatus Micrarchaeota archaeon]
MKGIIFLIDVLFAIMIAFSFIYIILSSSHNLYTTKVFGNPFPEDVAMVYSQTHDFGLIKKMYIEKGYSGRFDNMSIGFECDSSRDVYIKRIKGHTIIFCR